MVGLVNHNDFLCLGTLEVEVVHVLVERNQQDLEELFVLQLLEELFDGVHEVIEGASVTPGDVDHQSQGRGSYGVQLVPTCILRYSWVAFTSYAMLVISTLFTSIGVLRVLQAPHIEHSYSPTLHS